MKKILFMIGVLLSIPMPLLAAKEDVPMSIVMNYVLKYSWTIIRVY